MNTVLLLLAGLVSYPPPAAEQTATQVSDHKTEAAEISDSSPTAQTEKNSPTPAVFEPSADLSTAASNRNAAPPPKVMRYARRIIGRYDNNGDGWLVADEWQSMRGNPERADKNRDGRLTVEEFASYVTWYAASGPSLTPRGRQSSWNAASTNRATEPSATNRHGTGDQPMGPSASGRRDQRFYVRADRLPQGLPEWFTTADANGDGQLDLTEFLSTAQAGKFSRYDLNRDGLLTPREWLLAQSREKSQTDKVPEASNRSTSSRQATSPYDKNGKKP